MKSLQSRDFGSKSISQLAIPRLCHILDSSLSLSIYIHIYTPIYLNLSQSLGSLRMNWQLVTSACDHVQDIFFALLLALKLSSLIPPWVLTQIQVCSGEVLLGSSHVMTLIAGKPFLSILLCRFIRNYGTRIRFDTIGSLHVNLSKSTEAFAHICPMPSQMQQCL